MNLHRIDHVSLDVADRLRSVAWYRRERHRDHDSGYFADPDGSTLEIMVPTT